MLVSEGDYHHGDCSLLGGALGAFWNYKGKVVDSSASREDIYADHTEELFKRLDNLTNERDDLKQQNINLMNQVKQLRAQVRNLTTQVNKLTKIIEGRDKQ